MRNPLYDGVPGHRIRAVATVSAADIGRQFRRGAEDEQDAAAAARTAEAHGEGAGTFPIFPATEEQARAGGQHVYEGWEHYCTEPGTPARPRS